MPKREKWIIIFTDINDDTLEKLNNPVKDSKFQKEMYNVILVNMNSEKRKMEKIHKLLNFNKSEIIDFENFERLRPILSVRGIIRDDELNLVNERYDSEKKNI